MPSIKRKRPHWIPKPKKRWSSTNFNYNSMAWTKFSKIYRREHPLCAECMKQGKTTPSAVTDHIIPIVDGGSEWDESNLQALCASCHNSKSRKEQRR